MTLRFRNIDFDPRTSVETWPSEAVATAIERGSITQWRAIAAAIRDDPWGDLARTVQELTADGEPYGVGRGLSRAVLRARGRWEQEERETVARAFRDLRDASGLTAGSFARRLGTSSSRMSTYLTGQVMPSAALMVRARRVAEST